eukprot:scaffold626_cov337-Pavlova_lutheri.AAC.14
MAATPGVKRSKLQLNIWFDQVNNPRYASSILDGTSFPFEGGHVEDTCKIDFHFGHAEYLLNGVGPRRTARCDERVPTVHCTIAMTPRVFLNAGFLHGTHR